MTNPSEPTRQSPARTLDLRPLGIVAVAIAIVWATSIAANTWRAVRSPDKHSIRVTGSAKKRIVSDLIQ